MDEYHLLDADGNRGSSSTSWWRAAVLVCLALASTTLVFLSLNMDYSDQVQYPPVDLCHNKPHLWDLRATVYTNNWRHPAEISHDIRLMRNQSAIEKTPIGDANSETLPDSHSVTERLVCYYSVSRCNGTHGGLDLANIDARLCTHINIGMVSIANNSVQLSDEMVSVLRQAVPLLRSQNPSLKLQLWVGGGEEKDARGFPAMVKDHGSRKVFIQSLKTTMQSFHLDGVDLDWEFPSAYNKERQHLSQLLYEIKQEYRRERRDYLLSLAVAAPDGIALFAYDVRQLNTYADYVSLMTYDYHFYSRSTPFTGLNAPLYARHNEHSILSTLNINHSVNWWLRNGLDRDKLVVGLPLYGHSFTLVNPLNTAIGAPARSVGRTGNEGFTSFSEACWFNQHNIVSLVYDEETCSPYMSSASEWISFENVKSIQCKARYVKALQLGGVMVFSLNTDDFHNVCGLRSSKRPLRSANSPSPLPLVETVRRILDNAHDPPA